MWELSRRGMLARVSDRLVREARSNCDLISTSRRFPECVFPAGWGSFRLFESDRMFSPEFLGVLKSLVAADAGGCACIVHLDESGYPVASQLGGLVVGPETSASSFWEVLGSIETVCGQERIGWALTADRFACASDRGDVLFYCEKAEELAFAAFRAAASNHNEPVKTLE